MHDRARIGGSRSASVPLDASTGERSERRAPIGLLLFALLVLPVMVNACVFGRPDTVPWYAARRDPSGLAPDPSTTPEAVIQVYAARAVRWRGAFAVHSWVVVKPSAAQRYSRYEVLGFG